MATNGTKNNFQQLTEIKEQEFPHAVSELENKVMGTVRSANVVGSVVDLYIGKLVSTISSLFGANTLNKNARSFPKVVNQDNDLNTPSGNSK